jgi:iron(II)-dependent oxidoreductase
MLKQGRYALLLRPQIADNLSADQLDIAQSMLDEAMSIVPHGDVLLTSWRDADHEAQEPGAHRGRIIPVEAVYLDRYPVTNQQYQHFVNDGGYEQMSLWDESILPAVLDFVDKTAEPGPRYWRNGRFAQGEGDHPVVGVSWFEAAAYARWAGKRLPDDPEWVKAGSWPVTAAESLPAQRKYPWGDSMERSRANLWGFGPRKTVSVKTHADGASVAGVYQLIGNVWEWTASNFGEWDVHAQALLDDKVFKSIRGGAFDTYFDSQATCQFQSGENSLARKHNIGFRCAVAMEDLAASFEGRGSNEYESELCGVE